MKGNVKDLIVIMPPDSEWDVWNGETKEFTYKLQNPTHHVYKNIKFDAFTYIESKEQGQLSTKVNYAKVISVPTKVPPKSTVEVKVKVTIPEDYNETIMYEGEEVEFPFRVATKAIGLKSIEEF